jgi:hypothetical protein
MRQRGRKSLAAVVSVTGRAPAPIPPATLSKSELTVWKRVVGRSPIGLFAPEQADLLAAYVCHTCEAARLRAESRADNLSLSEFGKILGLAQRESALALSYGRALRLTPQSRIAARSAGRKEAGARADISALWHRDMEPTETLPDDGEPVDA